MTVGEVARASALGVGTVRFYEKEGLIDKPARQVSGYRDYPQAVVPRLRFIRRAKNLGFTLAEIKELLALRLDRRSSCSKVKARAEAKIADMAARIRSLRRMKRALEKLSNACDEGNAPTSDCPVLEALEGELQ